MKNVTTKNDSMKGGLYNYDRQSREFLITINNPITNGNYNHDCILSIIHTKFKNITYLCMSDEIGSNGTFHTHIYILLEKKKRWSSVRKCFPTAHLEPVVYGTPQQCVDYIKKAGVKYRAKAGTVVPETFYEEGTLPFKELYRTKKDILCAAEKMLDEGLCPEDILSQNILFRSYESIIRNTYYAKRRNKLPIYRDIKVVWHLGDSGTGKSHAYVDLCEKHSRYQVYLATDYYNHCASLFDSYQGERIVFLDEARPSSFRYNYILSIMQGYVCQVHARYSNVYSLWEEIHIASIYDPHTFYEGMVSTSLQDIDTEKQFLRRITHYVYHWIDEDCNYKEIEMEAKDYPGLEELKRRYH